MGTDLRRRRVRGRLVAGLVAMLAISVAVSAGSISGTAVGSDARATGTWRMLPQAPIDQAMAGFSGVWTGSRMIVFGGASRTAAGWWSEPYVGAAYDPATGTWSRLPNLSAGWPYGFKAVWTGKEMIAFSGLGSWAYDPQTNLWRQLPNGGGFGGVLAWTGRELIAWGGGCCGEDSSVGYAYSPTTNTWRKLPRSPLAPSESPIGVWSGRELVILVSGIDPDGKPYRASLARAAAYNPTTDTWRRTAPPPAPRSRATAVWDGREVLLVGGAIVREGPQPWPLTRSVLAYNPRTNHWRRLAPMETGRIDCAAVWTGKQLLIWGGQAGTRRFSIQRPPRGFAYDPASNRWSRLPQAPLSGRVDPVGVWTGRAMMVWGGSGLPGNRSFTDGATFTP